VSAPARLAKRTRVGIPLAAWLCVCWALSPAALAAAGQGTPSDPLADPVKRATPLTDPLPKELKPLTDLVGGALPQPVKDKLPEPARDIVGAPRPAPGRGPGRTGAAAATPKGPATGSDPSPQAGTETPGGSRASSPHSRSSPRRSRSTTRAASPSPQRGRPTAKRTAERRRSSGTGGDSGSPVVRALREVIESLPAAVKALLAALAGLGVMLGCGFVFAAGRARRLRHQREELIEEVDRLERVIVPELPGQIGPVLVSASHRPAEGPAAGGDFYDAFPLPGGRVGLIVGDVSGHGPSAIERTALGRYTLRAYLESGLSPRLTLKLGGRALEGDSDGEFITVVVAVIDAREGALTYACAGHPPPILPHLAPLTPVTACSSPPLGLGLPTGRRQTTVPFPRGALACLHTDGLVDGKTEHGRVGTERVSEILRELAPGAGAPVLLERLREETAATDDVAACIIRSLGGPDEHGAWIEELELDRDLNSTVPKTFLDACGVGGAEAADALEDAQRAVQAHGGAFLRVLIGEGSVRVRLPLASVGADAA
jgi:stage II sporulation SpoE-like protein